jgi:hypothetical protein
MMERESREYAIIKSHSDFLKGMRKDESVRKRYSVNYFVKRTQTTLGSSANTFHYTFV